MTDDEGRRYLDLLSGYSALNFGHRHPVLTAAAHAQIDKLTLTSRAFDHELLEPFAARLAALVGPLVAGPPMVLPMNTGAEAVETAIKAARKWGYDVKGVPADRATIIVADGNFHGRTTTIVSFSTDPDARRGFGPYTPGFRVVPYGDAAGAAPTPSTRPPSPSSSSRSRASRASSSRRRTTCPAVRALCTAHDVLLIADEIQSGLGRTGTTLASELWGVKPDLVTLGKALGGGVMPVSAVVGRADVLGVLTAGTHGSTFGGNPLACAVGLAVIGLLETGELQARATTLGLHWGARLDALVDEGLLASSRRVGLWAGLDVDAAGDRPSALRAPPGPRRAGQGHPRQHHPPGSPADDHARGPRPGARTASRTPSARSPTPHVRTSDAPRRPNAACVRDARRVRGPHRRALRTRATSALVAAGAPLECGRCGEVS